MGSEALPLRPLRRPLAVFLLLVLPALAVAGPSTPDAPALAFTGTAGAATTGPEPPGATGSGSTTWSPRSVPGPSPASPAAGAGAGAPSPGPSAEALPEVPEAAPRPGPWPEPVTDGEAPMGGLGADWTATGTYESRRCGVGQEAVSHRLPPERLDLEMHRIKEAGS